MKVADKQDVPSRLRHAALTLFHDRGYDRTTAAEIAGLAGVTERTFFRYFPDKREVLFDGEAMVRNHLLGSITDAPAGLGPLATLFRAFHAFEPALAENWSWSKPRQAIIAATPALRERELTKIDALTQALADSLRQRGTPGPHALLAARIGMGAFVDATLAWLAEPATSFGDRLDEARGSLDALLADER